MKSNSLLADYLDLLDVPHTLDYCKRRESEMAFQTLFGISSLLKEFGVSSKGIQLSDKTEIKNIPTPFIAATNGGAVIVTDIDSSAIHYMSQGVMESISTEEFYKVWNGVLLLSYPDKDACEPDYHLHARIQFAQKSKKWVLLATILFLIIYPFISNSLWRHPSLWFVVLIDIGGIFLTYMLVQKSINVKNHIADKFCGVLQKGGCDSILETSASKFFGIFGWSEVGFSYFTVSLISLLLFPSSLPALALCNICCLPFTAWSIWYQRFRAHKWCTLCVSVQCSLWLLFFSYLAGGWVKAAWPPTIDVILLGAAYLGVMLLLNAVMPYFENSNSD